MKSSVNKHVRLNKNSKIWNFCNIYGDKNNPVTIGKNTQIGSFTEIKPGVKIGNQCRFQSFVFVSEGTIIGNGVFVGPRVLFLNDKYPSAKNAINNSWQQIPCKINDLATIGGGAIIGPGVTIGKHAVIGMGSVVTKDVPNHAVIIGNPAKIIGFTNKGKYHKLFK